MSSPASKKLKTMDEEKSDSVSDVKKEDCYPEGKNVQILLDKEGELDYDALFYKVARNIRDIKNANRDIHRLFEQLDEKYADIADKFEKVDLSLQRMEKLKEIEKLQCKSPSKYSNSANDDAFSPATQELINTSCGPLNPDKLYELLDDKVLDARPKSVLPLVRNYTCDVQDLVVQLQKLKNHIKDNQEKYNEQRRLDVVISRRIDLLVPRILQEFETEIREGKRQTSIMQFTKIKNGI